MDDDQEVAYNVARLSLTQGLRHVIGDLLLRYGSSYSNGKDENIVPERR